MSLLKRGAWTLGGGMLAFYPAAFLAGPCGNTIGVILILGAVAAVGGGLIMIVVDLIRRLVRFRSRKSQAAHIAP